MSILISYILFVSAFSILALGLYFGLQVIKLL
uniref:Cytochrome b6-f complex subunit 6 n=1 Tax=Spyridia filamentosa TaxID=196632 RepID=A0A1Z1MJF0_SPYFI|nr:cytochrome b6-f complex subunit 6 [Spyridia filamentosa]ARW66183.1 cytochrome b6-f complex subunit 6 [Spyridia filamentosa]